MLNVFVLLLNHFPPKKTNMETPDLVLWCLIRTHCFSPFFFVPLRVVRVESPFKCLVIFSLPELQELRMAVKVRLYIYIYLLRNIYVNVFKNHISNGSKLRIPVACKMSSSLIMHSLSWFRFKGWTPPFNSFHAHFHIIYIYISHQDFFCAISTTLSLAQPVLDVLSSRSAPGSP